MGAIFSFHSFLFDTGGGNISKANFEAFLDYLVTKRNAGLLNVVRTSDLYGYL